MRRFLQFALLLACAVLFPRPAHAQTIIQPCPTGDVQITGQGWTTIDPTNGDAFRFKACLEPNGKIFTQFDNAGGGVPTVVFASQAGAALNTDLATGGGTDDTAKLQAVLTAAPTHAGGLVLVIDGPALVSGLNVLSNTSIRCLPGAGFYLKNASNREIIRNVNRSSSVRTDQNISVFGCYANGNKANQSGVSQSDNTPMAGIGFYGATNLKFSGNTVYNASSFGIDLSNVGNVSVDSDHYQASTAIGNLNTDGINIRGPSDHVTLKNLRILSGDDSIALNARTYSSTLVGPYLAGGPITNVTIQNIQFDGSWSGVDLISSTELIDDITVDGLHGTVQNYAWWVNNNAALAGGGVGNFGKVYFNDSDVTQVGTPYMPGSFPASLYAIDAGSVASLVVTSNLMNGQPIILSQLEVDLTQTTNVSALSMDGRFYQLVAGVISPQLGTKASDNFTRANGAVGGNWTTYSNVTGNNVPQIVSNRVAGQVRAQYAMAFWNANTFSTSQFSMITISNSGGNAAGAVATGVCFSAKGGYQIVAYNGGISIQRVDSNASINPLGSVTQAVSAGDQIRIEGVCGFSQKAIYIPVSTGLPLTVLNTADTTYKSGAPEIGVFGKDRATSVLANWRGGNLLPANLPP